MKFASISRARYEAYFMNVSELLLILITAVGGDKANDRKQIK